MKLYYYRFWKKAFDFSGRSQRSEFWIAFIINHLLGWGLLFSPILKIVFGIIIIIPSISLSVRRLHDTGKSGKLLLFPFIMAIIALLFFLLNKDTNNIVFGLLGSFFGILEIISGIWLFVLIGFIDSDKKENKYGKNPKKEDIKDLYNKKIK